MSVRPAAAGGGAIPPTADSTARVAFPHRPLWLPAAPAPSAGEQQPGGTLLRLPTRVSQCTAVAMKGQAAAFQ